MVTAAINRPTYRLGMFLNHILQPVSEKYCDGELIKDTTHFIQEIDSLKENNSFYDPTCKVGTLDVDALYLIGPYLTGP